MPDLNEGFPPVGGNGEHTQTDGSVSLFTDEDAVRVILHGAISHELHQDIRELVDDLISNAAATARRPVIILAHDVTEFGLQGVWLLLELRRAARPATVTVQEPSRAVRLALELHGLTSFLPATSQLDDAAAQQA